MELRPVLLGAFEESPTGNEYVIHRYRTGSTNWRTQFERLIRRSGQEPWGMVFQNLRSSREIELNEVFPWFTVCTWMGHTREVAREHYMSVPAEHVARAIVGETISTKGEKTARPAAQPLHAEPRSTSQEPNGERNKTAFSNMLQGSAASCEHAEPQPIPPRGVEPLSPG